MICPDRFGKGCEESPTHRTGCTADSDDGTDGGGGKDVRGGGKQVGRPSLMRCCGDCQQTYGDPDIVWEVCMSPRHQSGGQSKGGADQHGEFTAFVEAHTAPHERTGEPSTEDGANARSAVDQDQRQTDVLKVEVVVFVEVLRQPEEIEPPDRVGERLCDREGPGSTMFQNISKRTALVLLDRQLQVCLCEGSATAELVIGKDQP